MTPAANRLKEARRATPPTVPRRVAMLAVRAWLLFSPVVVAHAQSVVVGVIGDFGTAVESPASASNELAVAQLVKRWQPDFIIALGDNNYPGGAAATIDDNIGQFYHEFIHPYRGSYGDGATSNRFFPCLGNHDWVNNGQPSIDYFALPGNERYYRYQASPDLEWFALNSNPDPDGNSATSAQATWLRDALTNSTARWKLVYFHHPPYSAAAGSPGEATMRWPFAAWGATLVMVGHEHVYARLHTNSMTCFINGLGGDDIHPLGSPAAGLAARYNGDFGAMRLEATSTNLVCHFINRSDSIIDSYVFGEPMATPTLLASPVDQTTRAGRTVQFSVLATGSNLAYQWHAHSVAIPGATNRTLTLANVQLSDEGEYSATVRSGDESIESKPARLALWRHPQILQSPRSITTSSTATVTFRVSADGAGVLRHQWRLNGSDLPEATNAALTLANVSLAMAGAYSVRITDDLGSVESAPAVLTVLVRPVILMHPLGQTAVAGDTVVWSVVADGLLPMNYSWRLNGRVLTNLMLQSSTSYWVVPNVQLTNAGNYQVGITNLAGSAGRLTSNAFLVVLPDRDGDRMPDTWELEYGLNPDDPSDAAFDLDQDGSSNLAERLAGTDPLQSESCLRLESPVRRIDGRWNLSFFAVSNRTYGIEGRTDATEFTAERWSLLADFPAAPTNRLVTFEDALPALSENDRRIYRLTTPRRSN